jgi:hypothetical protein
MQKFSLEGANSTQFCKLATPIVRQTERVLFTFRQP